MHDFHLDALGCLAGTDKSSLGYRCLGRYGMVLRPFREAAINLFEIGVQEGYSLVLWEPFFLYATIVGLDFLPQCRVLGRGRGRVKIRPGYQEDATFLRAVAAEFPPTIVIDDGSHQASHILPSLTTLWPTLLPGGVYIIEDLQFHALLRAAANTGTPPGENPTAIVSRWVRGLLQDVSAEGEPALPDVDFILALPGAVAIGKTPHAVAHPAVLDATESAAARIGTATAWRRPTSARTRPTSRAQNAPRGRRWRVTRTCSTRATNSRTF